MRNLALVAQFTISASTDFDSNDIGSPRRLAHVDVVAAARSQAFSSGAADRAGE